ncbi:MAG TPA: TonB-dependent receptor, partial [Flavisolibacter sp.]|nr:TonB-dependent receptor [Flavisolibacter sp.]
ESAQLTTSVFSPFFTANLGLDIYFNGQEKDQYSTGMLGVSTTYQANKKLRLKWLASRFEDDEKENTDITGAYLFGDRDFDKSSSTFGLIINPLGAGLYQNYTRDRLNIINYNFSHKGYLTEGNHLLQWGASYDKTKINDLIHEWEYIDSAGYSLPYTPGSLTLNKVVLNSADLDINKYSGFIQDNIAFKGNHSSYTIQAGVRANYNDLNKEFLLSPRLNGSWKPSWKRDIIFKAAVGRYDQPPFYRELRGYDGTVHTNIKSQKSWQGVLGFDYNFSSGDRPLRLSAEAYYKYMTDVDPYDITNVHIRYFGNNNAKAYTEGIDVRLFGELVKDAESWVSIGVMSSKEFLYNQYYTVYKTDSLNKPVDSSRQQTGWFRRPTDRLITFGMFFQDYLATDKNFKVYLNALYGTNLPFNIPGSIQYRNAMTIPPYLRVDIGFSALLLDEEKSNRRSHSPFRNFKNIWATLEVFNLIDRPNTISHLLIKDFENNTFALPNRLTPRIVNI